MHSVVEIIPLLLHGSLILFFCGLVAFLVPVNLAMTVVAAAVLAIVAAVYSALTFLPLWYLDCPYRTPLSGAFWKIFRGRLWNRRDSQIHSDVESSPSATRVVGSQPSQVEAMSRTVLEKRSDRDLKALIWTVKSLADDIELEPFVEALPDVLWGPTYRRHAYEAYIRGLIHNPDIRLLNRIDSLLDSCDHGILSSENSVRRNITCYKAIWALASLSVADTSQDGCSTWAVDLTHMHLRPLSFEADSRLAIYRIPAKAMWLWNAFCVAKGRLTRLQEHLEACEADEKMQAGDRTRELEQISTSFNNVRRSLYMLPISEPLANSVSELRSRIDSALIEIPFQIILEYLSQSTHLDSPPYKWFGTHLTIQISRSVPPSLKATQLHKLKAESSETETPWILHVIRSSLSLWRPLEEDNIPPAVIDLLNWQVSALSRHKLQYIFGDREVQRSLWRCFPKNLFGGLEMQEESFIALWRLASFGYEPDPREYLELQRGGVVPHARTLVSMESLLGRLSIPQTPFLSLTHSIIGLLKAQILAERLTVNRCSEWEEPALFEHHLLPTETAIPSSDAVYSSRGRVTEAILVVMAEYLEHCVSDVVPYKAAETLLTMTRRESRPLTAIHPAHQIRFATAVYGIYSRGPCEESDWVQELREQVLGCELWELYAEGSVSEEQVKEKLAGDYSDELWPWLDDLEAQQKVRAALSNYQRELSANYKREVSITLLYQARVRAIIQGLHCWHPNLDTATWTDYEDDRSRSEVKELSGRDNWCFIIGFGARFGLQLGSQLGPQLDERWKKSWTVYRE
ncbi:hypothetical protein C8R47DRAFT_1252133 [Mycena vitilis]|nr:hypothetical protein C8R47DRAFT_1252133 [Mycena vitilis]